MRKKLKDLPLNTKVKFEVSGREGFVVEQKPLDGAVTIIRVGDKNVSYYDTKEVVVIA